MPFLVLVAGVVSKRGLFFKYANKQKVNGASMKCSICNKPIVLVPSAKERAAKYGGVPSDYTKLFTTHAECAVEKREQETRELMRSQKVSV